jgi:transposase
LRGVKVEDTKRGRKFQRLNCVAGYRCGEVIKPHCYAHSMTGDYFQDYCEFGLFPKLKKGDVVILDNAAFHRKSALQKLAERFGVSVKIMPPYSPDFNPIEKKWANTKRALPDLIPQFSSLEKAVYFYLDS